MTEARALFVLAATIGCSVVAPSVVVGVSGQSMPSRFEYESENMGTTFRIVAYAHDERRAAGAAVAAFAYLARLDSLFSDYRPDSEIARVAKHSGGGAVTPVSAELWAVLREAQRWARATDGAFDVTVGPLTRLWRWSARRGELPRPDRLASALAAVGFEDLVLDARSRGAGLARQNMSLDLGGIAKGYAAGSALSVLREHGVDRALVDAGGDVALGAPPPGEEGWLVALPDGDSIRLAHQAVATSGDAHRFVTVDGVRYSHVVDPRTGLGVVEAPTVTVVAPDAITADVLASALSVMDFGSGAQLVRSVRGAWVRVSGSHTWTAGRHPMSVALENRRDPS